MEWPIGLTGRIDPLGIVQGMVRRVPAPDGQVEAAGERHRIVDDDDLLVMRRPDRHLVIEAEPHLAWRAPVQRERGEHLALQRVEHGIVPKQKVDRKLRSLSHQRRQELGERRGISIVGLAILADETHAAVDIPADDEDVALRLQQGLANGAKEWRSVDQNGRTRGALNPPNILTGAKKGRHRTRRIRHTRFGGGATVRRPHPRRYLQGHSSETGDSRVSSTGLP
jgi:hypothetical protein